MRFNPKQVELLRLFKQNKLRRINILQGSVRSGKTWISLVLWAFWILTKPRDCVYIMIGKTLTGLKRNCLDLLQLLVGERNFTYSLQAKEARLFGRLVYLEGANDARAEGKIRGMTLDGAYCDEITLFAEDFFAMLLSRLSGIGAKLIGTTNPDTPTHWLKKNYIDRQQAKDDMEPLDILVMSFLLDDNACFLDAEYIKQLKREYVGVFYDRFILGLWVVAEGAIYKVFADSKDKLFVQTPDVSRERKPAKIMAEKLGYDFIQVGVDVGGHKSAYTFVASGIQSDFEKLGALCSERHNAKGLTPEDVYSLFGLFVEKVQQKYGDIDIVFVDSEAQTILNGLRERFPSLSFSNSLKCPINDRILCATSLMAAGRFYYTEDCKSLEAALLTAVYDPKSFKDKRLDDGTSDIDTLDGWEYSFERYLYNYAGDICRS